MSIRSSSDTFSSFISTFSKDSYPSFSGNDTFNSEFEESSWDSACESFDHRVDSGLISPFSASDRSITPGTPLIGTPGPISSPSPFASQPSPFSSSSQTSTSSNKQNLIHHAQLIYASLRANIHSSEQFDRSVAQAQTTQQALKCSKKTFDIARPIYITGLGKSAVVFKSIKKGDVPFSDGTFKERFYEVDTETWEIQAFCIERKEELGTNPLPITEEFALLNKLTDLVIPLSFIQGKRAAWQEHLMDGDLSTCPLDFDDENIMHDVAAKMAEELDRIHSQSYLHLDEKPENNLYKFNADGTISIKLTDMGFVTPKGNTPNGFKGSPLYISPESFINMHDSQFNYATEQHDGWALGMSFIILFEPQLQDTLIKDNPKLTQLLSLEAPKQLMRWYQTNWLTKPLTQHVWIKEPENKQSIEFVIFNLMQIDPALRWTPRQAADYLKGLQAKQVIA